MVVRRLPRWSSDTRGAGHHGGRPHAVFAHPLGDRDAVAHHPDVGAVGQDEGADRHGSHGSAPGGPARATPASVTRTVKLPAWPSGGRSLIQSTFARWMSAGVGSCALRGRGWRAIEKWPRTTPKPCRRSTRSPRRPDSPSQASMTRPSSFAATSGATFARVSDECDAPLAARPCWVARMERRLDAVADLAAGDVHKRVGSAPDLPRR